LTSDRAATLRSIREQQSRRVRILDEVLSKELLAACSIRVPDGRVVSTSDDAVRAARDVGFPVAVKIVASDVAHKSDADGVKGPLGTSHDVAVAVETLRAQGWTQFLVEHWEGGEVLCFLGLSLDGSAGPLVSFGLGGIWVEVLRDVVHRAAPVTPEEALAMIQATRGSVLFKGARGRPPVDLSGLCGVISSLSRLASDDGIAQLVREIDINPLLVDSSGRPVALDAAVVLRDVPFGNDSPSPGRPNENGGYLRPLLSPRSVAIVGASSSPDKAGYALMHNLVAAGFHGKIYPINPRADEILGRTAYGSVAAVAEPIDLAFIVLPRDRVLPAVRECANAGVRAVCIVTAGFGEGDPWGRAEQQRLKDAIQGAGMLAIGPNTIGLVTMGGALLGTFVPFPHWQDGDVAIIAQTGLFAGAVAVEMMAADAQRLGIAASVDIGNRVGIDELDLLNAFAADDRVRVIGLYIEGFADLRRFLRRAAEVKRTKPVIVLKPGRTCQGARASESHTGSLAQDDAVLGQLLSQHGIMRADNPNDFLALLRACSWSPLPSGLRVAILTYSGALGVIAADEAADLGLKVADLHPSTIDMLGKLMPEWQKVANPCDIYSGAQANPRRAMEASLRALLGDPGVDQVLALLLAVPDVDFPDIDKVLGEVQRTYPGKPLHIVAYGNRKGEWLRKLDGLRLPFYGSSRDALTVMARIARYAQAREYVPCSQQPVPGAPSGAPS
jgi:acyl-CoA synthetase (NDP forming)